MVYKGITQSMKKLNDDLLIFHKDKEPPVTIHLDLEEEEGIPNPSNLNKPGSPSFKYNPSKENDDSSPFEPPMVDTQDGFIPPSETSEQNQSKFSIHATLKRNQKLKRKVHEYRVLERYIKEDNEKLKLYSARLQDKN